MLRSPKLKRFSYTPLVTLILLLSGNVLKAQSLGDPVVKITFGSGTASRAGALAADSGSTTYTYAGSGEIGENYYTITNQVSTSIHGSFVTSYDHDYETNGHQTTGYMMVVNGNIQAGTVFTRKVTGLCGNTQYQFGVWIKNVLSSSGISPNMVFHLYAADGTTELGTGISTGDVPTGNTWHNYTANFSLPPGNETVIIKLVSNASGTVGNDFAVDDITFSPYGSTVSAVFTQNTSEAQTTCAGSAQTYTINATSTLASGYEQKLQAYVNGAWTDLSAASTQTSYTITSPTTAGTYLYRLVSATTDNISSASCVVASNNLTLTVSAGPVASFSNNNSGCLGSPITFTDNSTITGGTIDSRTWDFGDGQTSTDQNPVHTYAAAGDYTVKLTVGSSTCTSFITQQIHINAKPVAAFSFTAPACVGQPVTLTDNSTNASGAITQWIWNYGDGTTETLTSNTPFTHTYTAAGQYNITLQVASGTCVSELLSKTITISPLPVVDFSLPDICLSDAYAQFNNLSTISDNTQSEFTYLWNFGDSNATTTNPNTSTDKNPKHRYSEANNYTVTLTVKSKYGCTAATVSKQFTVNGATPVSGFTVENVNNLCSSDDVVFDNTATVDFGNITKVIFYYDYDSHPTDATVYTRSDNTIPADGKYTHNYGLFNSPLTKNYHVRMVVYSGETCVSNPYDKTITINANPSVTLSAIGSICQEASAVQITQDKQGFTGTGVFSGTGVSATGLFNPAKAGPGTFTITYLFTAQSGCTYTSSQQVTVNATPVITAPATLTVLEGGQLTINAKATPATGLTYKWTPATGLSDATILNPVANPTDDTQYTLTATSAQGCSASVQVFVSVLKAPVVPNTFTPNGDGRNDTWVIKYLDSYPNATVDIFSRYGEKVYSSVGYPAPWDGTYKGSDLPVGVYYYIINPKNGRSVMSGSLTIVR